MVKEVAITRLQKAVCVSSHFTEYIIFRSFCFYKFGTNAGDGGEYRGHAGGYVR